MFPLISCTSHDVQKAQLHADLQGFKMMGEQQHPRPQKKSRRKHNVFFINMMLLKQQALRDLVGTHLKGFCLIMSHSEDPM